MAFTGYWIFFSEYSYMHIQLVAGFMFEFFSNIWPTLVRTLKGIVLGDVVDFCLALDIHS